MRLTVCLLVAALTGCAGHQPKKAQAPAPKPAAAQPAPSTEAHAPPTTPPASVTDQLRETVHALSTEEWQDARKTGARALHKLADAIGHAGGERLSARVQKLHGLADAVAHAGALDYSEKTRAALAAAVDAIDALGGPEAGGTRGWVASARKAVDDISSRTPFELQRAAIQDAFRAVVDAYGVVSGGACTARRQ